MIAGMARPPWLALLLLCLALPAWAQSPGRADPAPKPGAPRPDLSKPDGKAEPRPDPARSTLDDLFARLAAAKDEVEAKGIAALIERRWQRSGSDTADLLSQRALEAVQAKEPALAVELLDRVIALKPDWAEAWHRRATAFFLMDDPAAAMADLRQVLAREPRHFDAWAGLGHIYQASGDKRRALESYRKALALHPQQETLKGLVDRLAPEIDGRDI